MKCVILKNMASKDLSVHGGLNMKPQYSAMIYNAVALSNELWLAHLGGDDAVVGVTLRDVGLSSRRGLFMPYVDRPTVHPDLLPRTLTETETFIDINSNTGGEREKKSQCCVGFLMLLFLLSTINKSV